ncbi:sterol desaturase family protein [Parafilimonas terrae]|uniref:Sterol desaturase/sphingolipid hydroxylase, fatty acid hydroxylase superfamily n=1 Tax=Parafilimonas terrae TaxID=1465490 RepID=A0A1I5XNF3_9BACT|nr:sterol desaturase family protein [Parafilimonas terrae]SFQ33356.1 Sterol desaturase/sphingolipid hydroxylase, fatty acid hydroxylase superfamily [Parafilimonas terrae]
MDSLREQWLILISTPIYFIIIGLEILLSHLGHRKAYTLKDTITNLYLMLVNSGIDLTFRIVYLAILQYFFLHAVMQWHNAFLYWMILLLAEDFLYYWLHRFDHKIRFFWATHVTHHSSEKLNFSVGFRSSVFQPLYRFIYFIPLAWFGFRPVDIVFMYSATQIWGIFVHTEMIGKMGWLEHILVTPSHHRVHHASNPKYLDKNMGMFLIVWDKLFGTFQEELPKEKYQTIKYGLTKNIENQNAVTIIFHEWRQMWKDVFQRGISFRQRLGYLFGPPGWSHDGSRMTSDELRASEKIGEGACNEIPIDPIIVNQLIPNSISKAP